MTPCPDESWIVRFLDLQVSEEELRWFNEHAQTCDVCQGTLERVTAASPSLLALVGAASQASQGILPEIEGYKIEHFLGKGAFGLVYKARSRNLGHVVALKVLKEDFVYDPASIARVKLEAEVLAKLNHPNIVRIFEIGTHGPRPFLALEFAAGGTLAKRMRGDTDPTGAAPTTASTSEMTTTTILARKTWDPRQAAALVKTLAEAVHLAHEQEILHRDLKPDNILLQDNVPKITDFGLAMRFGADRLQADGQLTQGAMGGTPSYMSPEQAANDRELIGRGTDVYSLGVILYELLTGRLPLEAGSLDELRDKLKNVTPASPRLWRPDVPKDLATICLHCLRKEPHQRFRTAQALAEELQRFLDHQPIRIRPVGTIERTVKWVRRHPIPTALILVTLLGIGGILWAYGEAVYERDEKGKALEKAALAEKDAKTKAIEAGIAQKIADANAAKAETARNDAVKSADEAEKAANRAQRLVTLVKLQSSQAAYKLGDAATAHARLDDIPPSERTWMWHLLKDSYESNCLYTLKAPAADCQDLQFHPHEPVLVSYWSPRYYPSRPRAWNLRTGSGQTPPPPPIRQEVEDLFSDLPENPNPGGINPNIGLDILRMAGDDSPGYYFHRDLITVSNQPEYSRSGFLEGKIGKDTSLVIQQRNTGQKVFITKPGEGKVIGFAFSPSGSILALQIQKDRDEFRKLINLRSGRTTFNLQRRLPANVNLGNGAGNPVEFVPGPGSIGGKPVFFDPGPLFNSSDPSFIPEGESLFQMLFSPDERQIAVLRTLDPEDRSTEDTVDVYDTETGQRHFSVRRERPALSPLPNEVVAAFSPDGRYLAAASEFNTLTLYDSRSGVTKQVLPGHRSGVVSFDFSADGRFLFTKARAPQGLAEIKLWDLRTGTTALPISPLPRPGFPLPSGCGFAEVSEIPVRSLADACAVTAPGWPLARLPMLMPEPDTMDLATDGIRVRTASPARDHAFITPGNKIHSMHVGADGTLVTGHEDGSVYFHDHLAGRSKTLLQGPQAPVCQVALSANGQYLAAGFLQRKIHKPAVQFKQTDNASNNIIEPSTLRASKDVSTIVGLLAAQHGPSTMLAATFWLQTLPIDILGDAIVQHYLRPDPPDFGGGIPGESSNEKSTITVLVWDLKTRKQVHSLTQQEQSLSHLGISSHGTHLSLGFVRVTQKGPVPESQMRFALWDTRSATITEPTFIPSGDHAAIVFSPDEKLLAHSGWNGQVYVREVATGKLLFTLKGHFWEANGLAFSPNGEFLVSTGSDRTVRLWDLAERFPVLVLEGHQAPVRAVRFAADGRSFQTRDQAGVILTWNGRPKTKQALCAWTKQFLGFSASGERVVAYNGDLSFSVWDTKTQRLERIISAEDIRAYLMPCQHPICLKCGNDYPFGLTADGESLVWLAKGEGAYVWSLATGRRSKCTDDPTLVPTLNITKRTADGRYLLEFENDEVFLVDTQPSPEEARRRWKATQPDAAWHQHMADQAEKDRAIFVTAFHQGRVADLSPWDVTARTREAELWTKAGQHGRAARAYLQAALLGWRPAGDQNN